MLERAMPDLGCCTGCTLFSCGGSDEQSMAHIAHRLDLFDGRGCRRAASRTHLDMDYDLRSLFGVLCPAGGMVCRTLRPDTSCTRIICVRLHRADRQVCGTLCILT